jgi:formate-dependent nitrite reductase membrane component NrfD/ferredoxin
MFQREDGIVDFDRDRCIGCSACIAACPYDAIYINPDNHSAEKCNFCAHRIDAGLEPACVSVCPTQAIIIGNMLDAESKVSQIAANGEALVRRPEKLTRPQLFYKDAEAITLITVANGGGMQMATQPPPPASVNGSGNHHGRAATSSENTAAAALLAYGNVPRAAWDWRVALYTWTKAIGAGLVIVLALLTLAGDDFSSEWQSALGGIALVFTGLTALALVSHLTHPTRFYRILIMPQMRSWLARGAFILIGYSGVLFMYTAGASLAEDVADVLLWPTAALAVPTAVYTAFLLRQARGRDLWQSPLLPAHFALEAVMAGFATLYIAGAVGDLPDGVLDHVRTGVLVSLGLHIGLIVSTVAVPHGTAHARAAVANLLRGGQSVAYRSSLVLETAALLLAAAGTVADATPLVLVAGAVALVGLVLYGHAYIQAGQSVPQA